LLYVAGITNKTSSSFDVILSDTPESMGYIINWLLPISGSVQTLTYDSNHTHTVSQLSQSGAISGQVLMFNGTLWAPTTISQGTSQDISAQWGGVSGDISAQADLVIKFNTKAESVHSHPISALTQSGAAAGQVIAYNGSTWVPAYISGSGGVSNNIFVSTSLPSGGNDGDIWYVV
jgi:hypothetical protein